MIDLFSSTDNHAYSFNLEAEDGFTKASGFASKSAAKATIPVVSMGRNVRGGGRLDGNVLTFTFNADTKEAQGLSGLGLTEGLPEGWHFVGATDNPLVGPTPSSSDIEFAWYPLPSFPYTLEYLVSYPEGADVEAGLAEMAGKAVYRAKASDDEYVVDFSRHAENADTDGDGIADVIEGTGDADGDGVSNRLDVDSDNDGLTDAFEAGYDGDSDSLDAFDPGTNPNGGDLDPYSADTDGDGISDGNEVGLGLDPFAPDKAASVPMSPGTLAALAALLACLGALLVRRETFVRVKR